MKKKIVIITMILLALAVTILATLVNYSDQSELSCKLIGGKLIPYEMGCMDCFSGCDSTLKEFFDYIRRGFKHAYLG